MRTSVSAVSAFALSLTLLCNAVVVVVVVVVVELLLLMRDESVDGQRRWKWADKCIVSLHFIEI